MEFKKLLAEATALVIAKYKNARLLEVNGRDCSKGTVADDVHTLRFVFSADINGTAFLVWDYREGFGKTAFLKQPWLQDCAIDNVAMDLPVAIEKMREAGFKDPFKAMDLRWPLYPGVTAPEYIFGCPKVGHIFVNTETGKVTSQQLRTEE